MRDPIIDFHHADARDMRMLGDKRYHAVVTSPPYFGLRKYGDGNPAQIGMEETPEQFCGNIVAVGREVRRVLRDDGLFFINMGDTYAPGGGGEGGGRRKRRRKSPRITTPGIHPKELIGIPWMMAFALRADGWRLRQEIIWAKGVSFCKTYSGSVMPAGVQDRCNTAHEHVFIFAKSDEYEHDFEAIRERKDDAPDDVMAKSRAARTVWVINTEIYRGGHYATWPTRLAERLIACGSSAGGCCAACGAPRRRAVERAKLTRVRPNRLTKRTGEEGTGKYVPNDTDGTATRTIGFYATCGCEAETVPCRVLDPFGGAASTAVAAKRLGRDCTIVDIMPDYLEEGRRRVAADGGEEKEVVNSGLQTTRRVVQTGPGDLERELFAEMPV